MLFKHRLVWDQEMELKHKENEKKCSDVRPDGSRQGLFVR